MTLRDLLKKKDKIEADQAAGPVTEPPDVPQFTFVRTTTMNEEVIQPPHYPGDDQSHLAPTSPRKEKESRTRRLSNLLHRPKSSSSDAPLASPGEPSLDTLSLSSPPLTPDTPSTKRLSHRLHLHKKSEEASPANVPTNLPAAPPTVVVEHDKALEAEAEARWEKRATLLVEGSQRSRSVSSTGSRASVGPGAASPADRPATARTVSNAEGDISIGEAIRLHEAGDLTRSTAMFGHLADPAGPSIALAQVLYGLALRHGWGVEPDAATGLTYLTYAASNSAAIESAALSSGSAKGGAAKGELVLAIFELANSFRNGWGVQKDPAAARQYYETAANLGDVDAMELAAWCYLEGFGGAKDKWKAAQFLRRAEERGARLAGESWIWKDKYNPDQAPGLKPGKKGKKG